MRQILLGGVLVLLALPVHAENLKIDDTFSRPMPVVIVGSAALEPLPAGKWAKTKYFARHPLKALQHLSANLEPYNGLWGALGFGAGVTGAVLQGTVHHN